MPPNGLSLLLELPQCLLVLLPLHPQLSVLALDPFELALTLPHLLEQPHTRLFHCLQQLLRPHLRLTPRIFQVLCLIRGERDLPLHTFQVLLVQHYRELQVLRDLGLRTGLLMGAVLLQLRLALAERLEGLGLQGRMGQLRLEFSQLALKVAQSHTQSALLIVDFLETLLIGLVLVGDLLDSIELLLSPTNHLFLDAP